MLKNIKKPYVVLVLTLIFSFALLHIVQAVTTQTAEPGTDADPVVSQSYVDQKVNDAVRKINELNTTIQELEKQLEEQSKYATFSVVRLEAGQQLIAGESAEIIVRSGKATAISGKNGDGLSDITSDAGKSLYSGNIIPLNHLLLVSRNDGRGIKAVSSEVYILFKGTYTIK